MAHETLYMLASILPWPLAAASSTLEASTLNLLVSGHTAGTHDLSVPAVLAS